MYLSWVDTKSCSGWVFQATGIWINPKLSVRFCNWEYEETSWLVTVYSQSNLMTILIQRGCGFIWESKKTHSFSRRKVKFLAYASCLVKHCGCNLMDCQQIEFYNPVNIGNIKISNYNIQVYKESMNLKCWYIFDFSADGWLSGV